MSDAAPHIQPPAAYMRYAFSGKDAAFFQANPQALAEVEHFLKKIHGLPHASSAQIHAYIYAKKTCAAIARRLHADSPHGSLADTALVKKLSALPADAELKQAIMAATPEALRAATHTPLRVSIARQPYEAAMDNIETHLLKKHWPIRWSMRWPYPRRAAVKAQTRRRASPAISALPQATSTNTAATPPPSV